MIILPQGCFTVIADAIENKTESGLYLGKSEILVPDTGTVTLASDTLKDKIGLKIRFRPGFAEEIEIDKVKHLYFRDFESSIYYIIKD